MIATIFNKFLEPIRINDVTSALEKYGDMVSSVVDVDISGQVSYIYDNTEVKFEKTEIPERELTTKEIREIQNQNNIFTASKKYNVPLHQCYAIMQDDKRVLNINAKQIVSLYKKGYSTNKLREMFNTSINRVVNVLKENGIKIRTTYESRKLGRKLKDKERKI